MDVKDKRGLAILIIVVIVFVFASGVVVILFYTGVFEFDGVVGGSSSMENNFKVGDCNNLEYATIKVSGNFGDSADYYNTLSYPSWDKLRVEIKKNGSSGLYGISDLYCLEELDISISSIDDLTPLENLTKMRELVLESTYIHDLSTLENFIELRFLRIARTKVTDLSPLFNLTNLIIVDIRDVDGIFEEDCLELEEVLPNAEVWC